MLLIQDIVNYIIKQKGVNKVAKTINVSVTERHSQNKNCYIKTNTKRRDKSTKQIYDERLCFTCLQ